MNHDALVQALTLVAAMALGGFLLGLTYFAALRRTVALYGAGRGWLSPAILTLGRIAVAVAIFAFAATLGALSLLAAFAGFLAARFVSVRRARRPF